MSSLSEPSLGTRLCATRALGVLDALRVPYEVTGDAPSDGVERVTAARGALLWPANLTGAEPVAATLEVSGRETAIPVFARIDPAPPALPGEWTRVRAVRDAAGAPLAAIWRNEAGDVFLPFDPDEVVLNFVSERYAAIGRRPCSRGAKRGLMLTYYRLRPLMPRPVQIALRRQFAKVQARAKFPRWPLETALHDFQAVIVGLLSELSGAPLPTIASWPGDHRWAFVLSHDVELTIGYENIDPVLAIERAHGFRSAWNFVPRRYPVDDARLHELAEGGSEIGVHGLYHDGRDLESEQILEERLPAMRDAAERWGAVGFRAPATHRNWDRMPLLGFDYDSSSPDSDPFEPQAGGCCSWLPFFNGDMVELPLTMPQDHTLFVILRRRDESDWVAKAERLRARGGMALMDTHPDYLVDRTMLEAYGRLLGLFADDATVWKALPREVSAWWRRRAASRLTRVDGEWQVAGPAAGEARVELVDGRW
jgi:hypothetical protein